MQYSQINKFFYNLFHRLFEILNQHYEPTLCSQVEMKKVIKTMGEKCKVSIRNIRREGNDELKKKLKSKEISEDDDQKNT